MAQAYDVFHLNTLKKESPPAYIACRILNLNSFQFRLLENRLEKSDIFSFMFDHFDGNKILWDKIFLHGNLSRLLDMRDTWIMQRE